MKEEYLEKTSLVNYDSPEIQSLIDTYNWNELDTYHKILEIYDFVQNKILFGYNERDDIKASEVLADGIGQCNTKAILLLALLRGVGVPARLHAFEVDKKLQKGATSSIVTLLAPRRIVHTWAEVYYNNQWIALEGVIIDKAYIQAVTKKFNHIKGRFIGYGIGTKSLEHLSVAWKGKDTFVQNEAIIYEYGVFKNPDDFYKQYGQHLGAIKAYLFKTYGRYKMTRNVEKIRNLYD